MRRLLPLLLGALTAASARAQGNASSAADATLFLLLPVGARATAMGTAMVAQDRTLESLWWNAAGLASLSSTEVSLNHSQSLVGTGDALSTAVRTKLGVLGAGFNLLQNEGGEVTGADSIPSGQLLPRNVAIVLSYATRLGPSLRLGASWKHVQLRFDCSGECPPNKAVLASTSAADFGAQYDFRVLGLPVTLGAALRHAGSNLVENDGDETDPTRFHLGAAARYVLPPHLASEASVAVSLDVVTQRRRGRPLPRLGAEVAWADAVFIRGGYISESGDTDAGGASLGIGFRVRRRLQVDFSRSFSGLSADAGEPPVQLALRLMF